MPDNEEFWNEVEAVPVSDNEFRRAMDDAVQEHQDRRATAAENVEVMRLGWLRWKYRFYWGRYQKVPGAAVVAWSDYETGTRITRQGALVAAARHLTKLQIKHSRTWEPKTGRS